MKYEKRKTHNMLSLLLDPRFKNLRLVSSFIGWKKIVFIVEDYDRWSLFPMLLECHHLFHLMLEFEILIDEMNVGYCCLDIFEMIVKTSERA
jgi:hypothetical protein